MHYLNLLAIDASTDICSISLAVMAKDSESKVYSTQISSKRQQANLIIFEIDELLKQANLSLEDITVLVLGAGPGKFTGLRLSTSVIQGLAYNLDKPIIQINSLKLYAQQFADTNLCSAKESGISQIVLSSENLGHEGDNLRQIPKIPKRCNGKPIWVCLKAYNDNYYQQQYILDNNLVYQYRPNSSYILSKAELLKQVNDDFYLVGSGWLEVLVEQESMNQSNLYNSIYEQPLAVKYIFQHALESYQTGDFVNAFDALPRYEVNPYSN